jgi:hypothetical protein
MTTSNLRALNGQLDEYRLDQLLDESASSHIYRAFDTRLQRYVRLRVFAPPSPATPEQLKLLLREAQTLAQLRHPHLARIHRAGKSHGLYYLAMQDVAGAGIDWLIEDYKQADEVMPLEDILMVACAVGSALDYMHGRGMAHRDIRVKNVIIDPAGQAHLTHFMLGSFEAGQDSRQQADAQNDLVAFGHLLFEMLTGEAPFQVELPGEPDTEQLLAAVPRPSAVNSHLTEAFDDVVLRCIDPDPARRFPTGAAICAALAQAASTVPTASAGLGEADPSAMPIPDKVSTYLHAHPEAGAVHGYPMQRMFWQSARASLLWLVASVITCLTLTLGMIAIIILLVISPNAASSTSVAATELATPTGPPETATESATAALSLAMVETEAAPAPSTTPRPSASPVQTVVAMAQTQQAASPTPAPSVPPEDRSIIPPNTTRLGEFAVEQYCNRQGYGVILTNGQTDWACTDRRTRSIEFILAPSDFDAICRERYGVPDAFAIRDQRKSVQAYNWSCFVYNVPTVFPSVTPVIAITPASGDLLPVRAPDWLALVNRSGAPVLVDSIEFQRNDHTLRSADWGISVLMPGECLRIARSTPPVELPEGCHRAFDYTGSEVTRRFWLDGEGILALDIGPGIRYVWE